MFLTECDSTNTRLKQLIAESQESRVESYLYTDYQTAGRGQTGNGWESERGKNLLCSILVESQKSKVESLFNLNAAVSVAVYRVIQSILCQQSGLSAKRSISKAVSIKWPNDIYWRDKKVAGILIENAIVGSEMKYSIAGIGLNVNQTEFRSDAPNPISLKQITGREFDIHALMERLYKEVQKALDEDVWAEYKAKLYRKEGYWPFVEREVDSTPTMNAKHEAEGQFLARIEDVLPTGEIVLKDQQGTQRVYHFKQIRYIL